MGQEGGPRGDRLQVREEEEKGFRGKIDENGKVGLGPKNIQRNGLHCPKQEDPKIQE